LELNHTDCWLEISPDVRRALDEARPVVALETTIVTHGLPRPQNMETAIACEGIIRGAGAEPATIGVLSGRVIVGLDPDQIRHLAMLEDAAKTNLSNLGAVLAGGGAGATSVSTTLLAAARAGIRVAATGGIGGVHRGYGEYLDVSADLEALARLPMVLVCAGAKSILDVAATREQLETRGIPVVGYGTDAFPLFYAAGSDLPVDVRADTPAEAAAICRAHACLGLSTSTLIVANPPAEAALDPGEMNAAIEEALAEAGHRRIWGRALTPFLLERVKDLTGGASLRANLALIRNNCRIAAEVAVELTRSPA